MRLASVLGRIGLAWMLGAFIYMSLKKSVQYGLIVFILVGYWLLLAFVPAPDAAGASPLSIEGNLVGYIDRHCLPGKLICGNFDPEGLLSTLPAIVTFGIPYSRLTKCFGAVRLPVSWEDFRSCCSLCSIISSM